MYNIGVVVALLIDKSEGAGEGSLTISAGVTGMILNRGAGCGESPLYVVDFGPEGQWHCAHNELRSLTTNTNNVEPEASQYDDFDEEDEWEDEEQDETEEEQEDRPQRIHFVETLRHDEVPPQASERTKKKKENKIVSFEDDLARMVKEKK